MDSTQSRSRDGVYQIASKRFETFLDVGEQAGEAVQPFLPSGTRCVSYVKMAKRFLESAPMYTSALGGREVQQWAQKKTSNGTMYGNAANDFDDHAQLADSESEL